MIETPPLKSTPSRGLLERRVDSHLVGVVAVVGLAAAIRFAVSAVPRLNIDEGWFYYLCRNPLDQVLWYTQKDRFPPLPAMLFKFWLDCGSHDEVRLRALYATVASLNVVLVYLLGRRLFGGRIGLGAALVSALSYPQWEYDTWMRAYGVLTFAALASTLCYSGVVDRATRRRPLWAVAYALSGTLLVYTHYIGVLWLVVQVGVSLLPDGRGEWLPRRRRLAWLAVCWAAMLLLFVPWMPILRLQMARRAQRDLGAAAQPVQAVETAIRFLPLETGLDQVPAVASRLFGVSLPGGPRASRLGWTILMTLPLGWCIALGVRRLHRLNRMGTLLLLASLVPAGLFILLIGFKAPELSRVRYYVPYIPLVGVLLAAGWAEASGAARRLLGVVAALGLAVNLCVVGSYLQSSYFRSADWASPAAWVRARQGQAQVILGHQQWMMHAFNYYYAGDLLHYDIQDLERPRYILDPAYAAQGGLPQMRVWDEEIPRVLDDDLKKARRVILMLWYDTGGPLRDWFAAHYSVIDGYGVDNVDIDGMSETYLLERREENR